MPSSNPTLDTQCKLHSTRLHWVRHGSRWVCDGSRGFSDTNMLVSVTRNSHWGLYPNAKPKCVWFCVLVEYRLKCYEKDVCYQTFHAEREGVYCEYDVRWGPRRGVLMSHVALSNLRNSHVILSNLGV